MEDYKLVRRIAEGRFGSVFEACKLSTGQRVAIKKIRARNPPPGYTEDPWSKSAEREIRVLGSVTHEHMVSLVDYMYPPGGRTTLLIYEYLAWNLETLLEKSAPLEEGQVKALLQMLFRGLAHLHLWNVMHRDLKPANILLDGSSGVLKIADFGSARFLPEHQSGDEDADRSPETLTEEGGCLGDLMTREVCTRWYKCPEMLFGSVDYTLSVDLWAAGCVACELLCPEGKPLCPGGSDLEQLCLVFQMRGTPHEEEWPEVCHLPDYSKVEFKARDPQPFPFEGHRSDAAVALASGLLQLTPQRRTSAAGALEQEFFREEPPPVEPCRLVQGLEALAGSDARGAESPSALSPLQEYEFGWGSEASSLGSLPGEFEPVEIETTSCELWDDVALGSIHIRGGAAAPCPPSGNLTPPPPVGGEHRFKLKR